MLATIFQTFDDVPTDFSGTVYICDPEVLTKNSFWTYTSGVKVRNNGPVIVPNGHPLYYYVNYLDYDYFSFWKHPKVIIHTVDSIIGLC